MRGEICPKMEFVPPIIFHQVQYCVKFEKLCKVLLTKKDEANLQSTLHKGKGDASLKIFVTDC